MRCKQVTWVVCASECHGEWKVVYEDVACLKKRQNKSTKPKDQMGAKRNPREQSRLNCSVL